jgi:hypothetical protein
LRSNKLTTPTAAPPRTTRRRAFRTVARSAASAAGAAMSTRRGTPRAPSHCFLECAPAHGLCDAMPRPAESVLRGVSCTELRTDTDTVTHTGCAADCWACWDWVGPGLCHGCNWILGLKLYEVALLAAWTRSRRRTTAERRTTLGSELNSEPASPSPPAVISTSWPYCNHR